MILKLLLFIGVIAFIYFKFIKKKPQIKEDELKGNDMVECTTCKIYCALEDTLISGGKYYCSKECLEKIK